MSKVLTRKEEAELFKRLRNGDKSAKDILVEHNMRLVQKMASKLSKPGFEFDDLVQEGLIGLLTAIDKYDYTRGYKFSTYSVWYIRQRIQRYMKNTSKSVRLPIHIQEKINKVLSTMYDLEQKNGEKPTVKEIAVEMKLDENTVGKYLKLAESVASLNQYVDDEKCDAELIDYLVDEEVDIENETINEQLKQEIDKVLDILPERERLILELRFGIGTEEPMTLEQIGNMLGLTRERIRQIEIKALKKLRRDKMCQKLKEYWQEI
ncbi:sigma-70 family RNA polymerase sigma factor [Thermoanaerobacterium butyriciformans]|uniref:RNA polymerase sigma factor n=1 Tax=Thermoanaerobacterium butyriciformans TaxID=1702242 RepID=A0ABS4NB28_9THEO|nr:RNA polymerase sigma factor RpoD/SigA [Thermoanaerobacterium butyriciformans]MBP2070863.1 RNA polymerase primary sigma factor [Thermoanaerobacterium butyriciformans]